MCQAHVFDEHILLTASNILKAFCTQHVNYFRAPSN